jgi:hypothetical protein
MRRHVILVCFACAAPPAGADSSMPPALDGNRASEALAQSAVLPAREAMTWAISVALPRSISDGTLVGSFEVARMRMAVYEPRDVAGRRVAEAHLQVERTALRRQWLTDLLQAPTHYDYRVAFDAASLEMLHRKHSVDGEPWRNLQPTGHDLATWLLVLRAAPLRNGDRVELVVDTPWGEGPFSARVVRRERIAQHTAIRIEIAVEDDDWQHITVWLSDDQRRLPYRIACDHAQYGHLQAELTSHR